ncbi:hypothetical protein CLU83_0464 [Flavobacterium sp. 1]|nr:hypothetical protein CLU83_0464 [Flavobacterium sp. 1]
MTTSKVLGGVNWKKKEGKIAIRYFLTNKNTK